MHVYSWPCEKPMFILDSLVCGQPTMAKLHGIWRIIHGCAEIPDLFREINLVFPSIHVFFCLLYKGQSLKSDNFNRKAIIEKR